MSVKSYPTVYKGNQTYSGIFTHLGKVQFINGCRIIKNQNKSQSWIAVCHSSEFGQIYLCEKIFQDNSETSETQKLTGWYDRWAGKKYLNFKLTYEGEFLNFMKHTQNQTGNQYIETKLGLETFVGHFKYNKRHSNTNSDQVVVKNAGTIIEKLKGSWENGNKQGIFKTFSGNQDGTFQKTKIKIIQQLKQKTYYNDLQVEQGTKLKARVQATQQINDKFSLGMTREGIKSLKPGLCLHSEMLDLFFKHLNVSFQQYSDRAHNMKAHTVFMFQKLVPSGKVSDQRNQKVSINYKSSLQSIGSVYKNTSSIFEVNPLILMPLNRDQSHFALGAIHSQVKRSKSNKLESVEFKVFYLDPLHNREDCVPLILRQYIKQQINANIEASEKAVYNEGWKNVKIMFKTKQFTGQNNEVDCGVFTCIYGLLLTIEVCLNGYQIQWKWEQKKHSLVKWIRSLLQLDGTVGIHSFFSILIQRLIKLGIVKRKK